MIQGTTPTIEMTLPFEVTLIKSLCLSLAQGDKIIIEKSIEDCVLKDKTITVQLTQEETLKLENNVRIQVQLKVLTHDDNVLASDIYLLKVEEVLCKKILV